nr:hypothetical protein CFP56_19454 [Quercus suber]
MTDSLSNFVWGSDSLRSKLDHETDSRYSGQTDFCIVRAPVAPVPAVDKSAAKKSQDLAFQAGAQTQFRLTEEATGDWIVKTQALTGSWPRFRVLPTVCTGRSGVRDCQHAVRGGIYRASAVMGELRQECWDVVERCKSSVMRVVVEGGEACHVRVEFLVSVHSQADAPQRSPAQMGWLGSGPRVD